jgi:hypothetical protein
MAVLPSYRVQVEATRFRVPDVTVVDLASPVKRIATRPPIAVFEVLSPEDTVLKIRRKLADYAKMGIPQIWVVDPEDGASLRYLDGELLRGEVFEESSRGISFRIEEMGSWIGGNTEQCCFHCQSCAPWWMRRTSTARSVARKTMIYGRSARMSSRVPSSTPIRPLRGYLRRARISL